MPDFVADANTTLAWLLGERALSPLLPQDFDQAFLIVPWLWRIEVANVITRQERQKRLTVAQATRLLQIVDAMQVEVVSEPINRSLEGIASFARPFQLTTYDAVYLELAITTGLPLCSLDRNLQDASRRSGVPLIVDFESP